MRLLRILGGSLLLAVAFCDNKTHGRSTYTQYHMAYAHDVDTYTLGTDETMELAATD